MATDLLEMSVELAKAHLAANRMSPDDVPNFIRKIHATLQDLAGQATETTGAAGPRSGSVFAGVGGEQQTLALQGNNRADAGEDGHAAKVAAIRQTDLCDPAFEGLDPWLGMRISAKTARKLDPHNAVHPSVFRDHLICLEDGGTVTLLRPYLRKRFGLTPAEYVEKWNLPDEFPMAPPAYVENKRKLALKSGLGVTTRAHRERPRGGSAQASPPLAKSKPGATKGSR